MHNRNQSEPPPSKRNGKNIVANTGKFVNEAANHFYVPVYVGTTQKIVSNTIGAIYHESQASTDQKTAARSMLQAGFPKAASEAIRGRKDTPSIRAAFSTIYSESPKRHQKTFDDALAKQGHKMENGQLVKITHTPNPPMLSNSKIKKTKTKKNTSPVFSSPGIQTSKSNQASIKSSNTLERIQNNDIFAGKTETKDSNNLRIAAITNAHNNDIFSEETAISTTNFTSPSTKFIAPLQTSTKQRDNG